MSLAYSRKHWRQMCSPYLQIRPSGWHRRGTGGRPCRACCCGCPRSQRAPCLRRVLRFNHRSEDLQARRRRVRKRVSPFLYVAASQPLAAYTRSLAAQGVTRPILLPSGRPAPHLHQQADDTTVHVRTRADARLVIDGPIQMFCKASGSLVQPSKSPTGPTCAVVRHVPEVCAPEGEHPFSGLCPLTGITFVAGTVPITHSGVLLGRDPAVNAEAAYTALIERMQRRAQRYMRIDLGFYGRAYIA